MGVVRRGDLVSRVLAAPSGNVVLIVAPAGFGKSTVVDQICEALGPTVAVALELGRRHGEVRCIAADLLAAVGHPAPDEAVGIEDLVNVVLTWLDAEPDRTLILDDLHSVTSTAVHHLLGQIASNLRGGRLVLASRSVPPIGVARLKVRRRLAQFGVDDLMMTAAEAQMLVHSVEPRLASGEVSIDGELQWAHGWPAGIILVALALQRRLRTTSPSLDDGTRASVRSDVREYIRDEILATLPPALSRLALELATVGIFNGDAAAFVTADPAAHGMLDDLVKMQLFIEPERSDPSWLRFHDVFGEALRHEAAKIFGHARCKELQLRLLEHLVDAGNVALALDRMVSYTDPALAAYVVNYGTGDHFWSSGGVSTAGVIIGRVPVSRLADDDQALYGALYAALAIPDLDRAAQVRAALHARYEWDDPRLPPNAVAFEGLYADLTWHHSRSIAAYELAIPAMRSRWPGTFAEYLTRVGHTQQLFHAGRFDEFASAVEITLQAGLYCGATAHTSLLLAMKGLVALWSGNAEAAAMQLDAARAADALNRTFHDVPIVGSLQMMLAARRDLTEALRIGVATVNHPDLVPSTPAAATALAVLANIEEVAGYGDSAERHRAIVTGLLQRSDGHQLMRRLIAGELGPAPSTRAIALAPRSNGVMLTDRERRIMRLLDSHLTLGEIGGELHLSVNTVKTYVASIYRKLGVNRRSDAVGLVRAASSDRPFLAARSA